MPVLSLDALACPLDHTPLHRSGAAWRCANGHSYDIAREGYTHLLPVQNKRSLDPGDSKAMVVARRQFLESGVYEPIAEAVSRTVLAGFPESGSLRCLDAGCGEGYYLRQLAEAASPDMTLELLGLDISKWAVQAAARQQKRSGWVVGSNANLPILSGSLDWVICLFGFPVFAEFARVLKPNGELLLVNAGADHLKELREVIYPVVKEKRAPDNRPEGFTLKDRQTLRFEVALETPGLIADLLAMTPHLYRAPSEGVARAAALKSLKVTVDVILLRHTLSNV
jgi:23S rRNA (guanine745-N1)-methyltransferase